jgi:glucosamine--fructose-6-phosphate aminotransferase (isomerizing)
LWSLKYYPHLNTPAWLGMMERVYCMCGIVGYIGSRPAQDILLNGLKRLEYRGYDSSGMCLFLDKKQALSLRKLPGKIKGLETLLRKKPLSGTLGIAHTRWATHGAPNQVNAHPHLDCNGEIALVHNGIIENYLQLKSQLITQGHVFKSLTDTEVIVHLIEDLLVHNSLEEAVRKAVLKLEGSFALAVISQKNPDKLIGARSGSPLIVGVGDRENFLASDVPAILDSTKEVIFLEEREMAVLRRDGYTITDLEGREISRKPVRISWDITQAQKQGYRHFMLKEINEQPGIMENLLKMRLGSEERVVFEEQKIPEHIFKEIKNITIVACGTAYHAGLVGKYAIESLCAIPVNVDVSSEFRYRSLLLDDKTLVIAISQSGETADTLAGIREAKRYGAKVLSICNVLGSTLTRESDGVIYTHAGPEIGVASTKAYTAQVLTLYLLAFYLAGIRGVLSAEKIRAYLGELKKIPDQQAEILKKQNSIASLARRHSHFGSFLYLGRNINFPSALEGALKLKEISYIPAEGYAAGEMKHGPIALIDEYRAVVCLVPQSQVYEKMISNIQEIRARQGKLIVVATVGDAKIKTQAREVVYVPKCHELFSPLLVALPLQLLAYHIAVKRGCDVDQPRNLAKSVTVE